MSAKQAGRSRSWKWLHGCSDPLWGASPEGFDADHVQRVALWLERVFGPQAHYPVRSSGQADIPDDPVMVVSNHSGGSTVLDCLGLGFAWYRHFGRGRPLHFLAHEILLATSLTGPFFHKMGVLRASPQLAYEALGHWGRDIAVMPGGDRDTWRPWRDRYRVQFAGHTGYARVALRAGVPIVPVANAGAHDTLMVLTDGRRMAARLRLHDIFRIDVFPIHLSLPWGVGIGPWPHLPLPTSLRYRFGAPVLPPEAHPRGIEPRPSLVAEYDRMVRVEMQCLLDGLSRESPARGRILDRFRTGRAPPLVRAATDPVALEDGEALRRDSDILAAE
jgi:1-acyl-sn-glycerol-3-phosphate acyltransferase